MATPATSIAAIFIADKVSPTVSREKDGEIANRCPDYSAGHGHRKESCHRKQPDGRPCQANPSGFRVTGDARWPFAFCAANQAGSPAWRFQRFRLPARSGFKGSTGSLVRSRNSLLHSRNSLVHSRNTTDSRSRNGDSNSVATGTRTDCTHSARFGPA